MAFQEKVRARVKAYFKHDTFDALGFRKVIQTTLLGVIAGEVMVFMMLRESADVGELPSYITDVLIISISCLEFFLAPLIGWLGTQRRRIMLVMWLAIALVGVIPVFGAPSVDVEPDVAYCGSSAPVLPEGVSTRAAIRLAILILAGLSCALARVGVTAHTLGYLDEYNPSVNLHMNVAMLLIVRTLVLHVGTSMLGFAPWVKIIILVAVFLFAIFTLHKYPVVPPTMSTKLGSDRTLFRSLGRVLSSKMAMLQILSMSLLASAMWGFGTQEAVYSKMKYHVIPGSGFIWDLNAPIRALFVILGVTLLGFLYSEPEMIGYKQRRALKNAGRMALYCLLLFVVMTAVISCSKGPVAGLDSDTYNQPACGQSCGCDRPWTEFDPVCVTEQMTTYFSPCHAGCASFDTVGDVGVYSNCTCAGGGRVTAGACVDGSCYVAYGLQTLIFTGTVLASTLSFSWLGSVMLLHVDRRDKSTAVGLASGIVSLCAFVGAHGFFMWIRASTCAQFRGEKCLIQNSEFVPWVGYSSAALAGGSMIVSFTSFMIIFRRKRAAKKLKEAENIALSS